ncbi:hypothetical protein B0H34DRAFT_744000 [Crassisporium funariophilum]|nr:hypothetical protein B0H34DRAFT_744000 [Crassisporium funariophilum]
MYTNNPYAQAGWYNPENAQSINGTPWRPSSRHPPTFGALTMQGSLPISVLDFEFTSFDPDVLNCRVTGPNNRACFAVTTPSPGVTFITAQGETSASINWQSVPTITLRGIVDEMDVADFLKLSVDQRYRTMSLDGRQYVWTPRTDGIYLYSSDPNPPLPLAKITSASKETKILLRIASEAFRAGIFEACILVTVLLLSGRNLD